MEHISTKNILTKVNNGQYWFGIDYNINLYRGCSHGCIYCDSRSECYHIENFDQVKGKKQVIEILEKELMSKRKKGIVGIGAMSDTYNPFEKKYEYTKKTLELIHKYHFGVSIDTKSDLIIRDIPLLQLIQERASVIVKITITTSNDDLSQKIEPNVSSSTKRFEAIKKLSDAGIYVGILLNPVLPFITDTEENIKSMVTLAYQNGAKFIYTNMGMTLRSNQRLYYYQKLKQLFPGIEKVYQNTYGEKYYCSSIYKKKLYNIFITECKKYNLLYRMEDIIKKYKSPLQQIDQLSLF